jgi:hypothetical protein
MFHSEASIRHKNRDIYQNRTKQLLSEHGCQRRCYGQYLHVVQQYLAKPPTYIYTVKMTESDHKKAYQE